MVVFSSSSAIPRHFNIVLGWVGICYFLFLSRDNLTSI